MADWFDNVPAPMSADGEIVPLLTKKLYAGDGKALDVELIGFDGRWVVTFDRKNLFNLDWFCLSEPDSWEKLEEDLDRCISGDSACRYFTASENCEDCRIDKNNEQGGCVELVFKDIVRRIRKLRGESDV